MENTNILSELFREKLASLGISEREAARQIGISPTSVGRVLGGDVPTIDTLLSITKWLGVSPSSVLDAMLPDDEDDLGASIATILKTEPELGRVFGEAIAGVARGTLAPSVVRDIVRYATFRLSLEKDNENQNTAGTGEPGSSKITTAD